MSLVNPCNNTTPLSWLTSCLPPRTAPQQGGPQQGAGALVAPGGLRSPVGAARQKRRLPRLNCSSL